LSRADGWRLHVAHETRFDYNAPARASYNELRLTPRTERRQTALETKIVTMPPAPQYSYVDYWGTQVVAFNVDRGHEMLSITGTALIDTQRPEAPDDASWDEVVDASLTMADHLSHKLYTACAPPGRWRRRNRSWPGSTGPCATSAASPACTPRPTRPSSTGPACARTSPTWPWP
jgi:transglutaminase-like putative cysteine protease